ncbi:LamG-like jellyroll fold domain-containing protein [Neolewinella persica]|uniref:LamG-like jellyroll fold domain-containing protein n=1 Tax=Neolewinella persica TaxID=70998 RepID=UPI00036C32BF|nr:LamG-like jellyroll fold domain-containing protein [Neolewinella persica]
MKSFLLHIFMLACISHGIIAQDINNSLHFESDDYVDLSLIAQDINGLNEFTIEFWVQFDAQQNIDYNVFYSVNSSDYRNRFLIRCAGPIDGVADAAVVYINDGSNQYIVGTTPIGDNKCHHIAFTYDNGVCLLYVDGQLDGSGNYIFETQTSDLFSLGQEYDRFPISATAFYNGKLDDFRIWEVVKSQSEIESSKDVELNGNEANLVTYFNFNQGLAGANNSGITNLNNLAQPNKDGTLINFNLNGSTSNFISGSCSNTLPVDLYSFEIDVTEKTVSLNWQTASELNNDKFEVEESRDGSEFQKIGEVKGSETTLTLKNYTYKIQYPQVGLTYYRLKQLDFDGEFEYSKVVSLILEGENEQVGNFYPNPSESGEFNLNYTSTSIEDINITIFDLTGRIILSQNYSVSTGRNILSLNFLTSNEGVLIARVDNGIKQIYRKLLIK